MKTHLEVVNNILIRLRERQVSTVNETNYSALVSVLVNDAKDFVQAAWQWSALRETITINTVADTAVYTITGTDSQSTVLDISNTTQKGRLHYRSHDWFKGNSFNPTASGSPMYYVFNGVDAAGHTQLKLAPTPNAAYAIDVDVIKRNGELVNDSDLLKVPHLPVQGLAYAMALEERGEDGGMSAVSAKALAANFLSDAIALDTQHYPEELVWENY